MHLDGLALCDSHLRVEQEPMDREVGAQAAIPHLPRIRMNARGEASAKSGILPVWTGRCCSISTTRSWSTTPPRSPLSRRPRASRGPTRRRWWPPCARGPGSSLRTRQGASRVGADAQARGVAARARHQRRLVPPAREARRLGPRPPLRDRGRLGRSRDRQARRRHLPSRARALTRLARERAKPG